MVADVICDLITLSFKLFLTKGPCVHSVALDQRLSLLFSASLVDVFSLLHI